MIPAASFKSDGANPDSSFFDFNSGHGRGSADAYGCLTAAAPLPAGVTVSKLAAVVQDNDPTNNLTLVLRRVDTAGSGQVVAQVATNGSTPTVQVLESPSITHPVILHPHYSYHLTICLISSSLRLYSVRIHY